MYSVFPIMRKRTYSVVREEGNLSLKDCQIPYLCIDINGHVDDVSDIS